MDKMNSDIAVEEEEEDISRMDTGDNEPKSDLNMIQNILMDSNGQDNYENKIEKENDFGGDVNSLAEKETIDLEEKRRRECLGNMEKIEKEFADLKEKFFCRKD